MANWPLSFTTFMCFVGGIFSTDCDDPCSVLARIYTLRSSSSFSFIYLFFSVSIYFAVAVYWLFKILLETGKPKRTVNIYSVILLFI